MTCYDIHTHHISNHRSVISILNTIIGAADFTQKSKTLRSVGIHPFRINLVEKQLTLLRQEAAMPGVAAIGETGLDKRAATDLSRQLQILYESANIAESLSLPLILHCVKAWDELIASKRQIHPNQAWIIHGFRGGAEQARQLLRQGFILSFGPYFQPDAARAAWPDRFLAETDEYATDIRTVYTNLAESLRLPLSALAEQIARNAQSYFPCFR